MNSISKLKFNFVFHELPGAHPPTGYTTTVVLR